MAALEAYAWPGNVRELLHAVERAVILSKGDEIFPRISRRRSSDRTPRPRPRRAAASKRWSDSTSWRSFRQVSGHRGKAAALLAIDPKTLYRKINTYGIARRRVPVTAGG